MSFSTDILIFGRGTRQDSPPPCVRGLRRAESPVQPAGAPRPKMRKTLVRQVQSRSRGVGVCVDPPRARNPAARRTTGGRHTGQLRGRCSAPGRPRCRHERHRRPPLLHDPPGRRHDGRLRALSPLRPGTDPGAVRPGRRLDVRLLRPHGRHGRAIHPPRRPGDHDARTKGRRDARISRGQCACINGAGAMTGRRRSGPVKRCGDCHLYGKSRTIYARGVPTRRGGSAPYTAVGFYAVECQHVTLTVNPSTLRLLESQGQLPLGESNHDDATRPAAPALAGSPV